MQTVSDEQKQPDWEYLVDVLSRQLQLDRNGEGEGWDSLEKFVVEGVFAQEPENAGGLYAALAGSADPAVRLKALDGLDRLSVVDPEASRLLLERLMEDDDVQVRHAAYHIATQFG